MILLALTVGFIIYAILLWLLAKWAVHHTTHSALFLASVILIALCFSLALYGLFFSEPLSLRPRFAIESLLQYVVVPLFLCFPAAITISITSIPRHLKPTIAKEPWFGFFSGLGALCVLPFATIAAGCGLAGACF